MIRFYFASSVDGYIATREDSLDWLSPYQNDEIDLGAHLRGLALVVMGRRTYEKVETFGAWPYAAVRGLVLSSNPIRPKFDEVTVINEPLSSVLKRLRDPSVDGDIWVEGGKTMGSFLEAGAVDLIEQYTVPVVLGDGIPMFGGVSRPTTLEMLSVVRYSSGLVQHIYKPHVSRQSQERVH